METRILVRLLRKRMGKCNEPNFADFVNVDQQLFITTTTPGTPGQDTGSKLIFITATTGIQGQDTVSNLIFI